MIATLPAVQKNCQRCDRYACFSHKVEAQLKRQANRRHRRALNRAVRAMVNDPERWWNEGFNAYSLSDWELW